MFNNFKPVFTFLIIIYGITCKNPPYKGSLQNYMSDSSIPPPKISINLALLNNEHENFIVTFY